MFETDPDAIEVREAAPAPVQAAHSFFPPAPYFLLALGVGLFIGLALLGISSRQR